MSGELPKGWVRTELGAFCVEHSRRAKATEIPIFSVSKDYGLIEQSVLFDRRIASADTSNYKTLRRGEYAYDPMLLWTGSIGCLWRAEAAMISPAYTTFGLNGNQIHTSFFNILIKMPRMVERYRAISHGTNVRRKKAHFDDFCALVVSLPPVAEQRAIVEVLSAVEEVIGFTEALIAQLNSQRATLFKLRADQKAGLTNMKIGNIISSLDAGVSVGGEIRPREPQEFGVLRTSSVSTGNFLPDNYKVISRADVGRMSVTPKADRIIISRANTPDLVGASAYVKEDHENLFLSDKLWQIDVKNRNEINVRWLSLVIGAPATRKRLSMRANGTSGSMQNISKSAFLNLEIEVPSIEVQINIANIADAIETRQLSEQKFLADLKSVHKALALETLSGRLRLPENIVVRHLTNSGQPT